MSVVVQDTGETIKLNEVYAYLAELVQKCGNIIRDAFYKEKTFSTKESFADFVTETDTKIEYTLIEALKQKYPTHHFIGEESTTDKVNFNNSPVWIIDPVDGTTNFVHKFPYCALSIAFYVNKEAQIGIVFNPIRDDMFSAIKGQGAYLNGRTIRPSGQKELNRAQIITEFGSGREVEHLNVKAKNMRNLIERVQSIRCLGSSALNACYVASGSGDLYYEFGIHIWDLAASSLIAREAGCVVCDTRGRNEPFDLINRRILVAATPELADQVVALIDTVIYKPD